MTSWLPGKKTPCPKCGGNNIAVRKSKGILSDELTLCAERICRDCETIFVPPVQARWAIVSIVVGCAMCLMIAVDKTATIYSTLFPLSLGRFLMESFFAMGLLVLGIQIVAIGWAGLRQSEPKIKGKASAHDP